MSKRFRRYFPVLLVVFLIQVAALGIMRSRANASIPMLPDECPSLPNDGKGRSACLAQADNHIDHNHVDQTNDYEPNHVLRRMAATLCVGGSAGSYPCDDIDLMSFLPLADIGGGQGNDIWGWTDSQTGKEYALMGRTSGTSFVDISDPENPIYLGNLPTHSSNSSWRDLKVYSDHAYIVSEASSHGMQIFDLTQLRSVSNPPVTFNNTAHYNGFSSAHNIVINEDSGYAYAVGTNNCSGGLHMVNIQNPTSPVNSGCYSADGYTHDAQCVNYTGPDTQHQGKEICFNSNEDTLTIVDVTNKSSMVQLSRTGYSGSRYTHQGWLTEDQTYFVLDDELDEQQNGHNTRTYIWDVSDLDNVSVIGTYNSAVPAIDHNLYVKGDYVYQANYRAGLRILDTTNVGAGSLTEVAYFDIYPSSNSASFNGAWSNYPYFDSGNVIVSGIEQGLFVLRPNLGAPVPTATPTTPPPTSTPLPGNTVFFDGFESDQGWVTNPNSTDTATTGQWEVGDPQGTSSSGVTLQLDNAATGANDLVTGRLAGSSAGTHDIDSGETSVRSPNIALPSNSNITLSFSFYMAHLNNATTDDYLRVKVVGSSTSTVFEELGSADNDAGAWDTFSVNLDSFAGQTVYLLVEAADGGGGSLVEAALDDVLITADSAGPTSTPTNTPVPPTATNTPLPPTPTNTPLPPTATPTDTPVPPTATPTNTPVPGSGPNLATGVLTNVGSTWTTVNLGSSYTSMVVVANPNYSSADLPAVVRIRNASGSSFDIRVENPSGTALSGYTVHYMVVEAGVYTVAQDGVKMEAVTYNSTVTADNNSWVGESRSYSNSYTSPVVLGQVMTSNDVWSVFWNYGSSRSNPPNGSTLFVGKNVAEDPNAVRANETVGYIVIEAGTGSIDGVNYTAALGADTVRGTTNSPPYNYTLSGLSTASVAIITQAAMDGGNGGWAYLYGSNPLSATTMQLAIEEDQVNDPERNHTTEQVGYIVFE